MPVSAPPGLTGDFDTSFEKRWQAASSVDLACGVLTRTSMLLVWQELFGRRNIRFPSSHAQGPAFLTIYDRSEDEPHPNQMCQKPLHHFRHLFFFTKATDGWFSCDGQDGVSEGWLRGPDSRFKQVVCPAGSLLPDLIRTAASRVPCLNLPGLDPT